MKHVHIHFHETRTRDGEQRAHTHAVSRVGLKPILIGAMHGLAGSGALTLLVLTQVSSVSQGLLYLTVFGIGSVGGMLLMSTLVGLPFALMSRKLTGVLQTSAAVFSLAFGVWYAYATVFGQR